MGMDVIGNNPTSEVGSYFRHTCWAWHPLAEYVCEVAPEITSRCTTGTRTITTAWAKTTRADLPKFCKENRLRSH